MRRERFLKIAQAALDRLPARFRERMHNIAVLVEDRPGGARLRRRAPRTQASRRSRPLLMGVFVGTPTTRKSFFDVPTGPDHIILYQKNIEAVCRTDAEVREEIRRTVIHELGHYFGLEEDKLWDV